MDRKEAILRIKKHMKHHGIGKYPHLKLKEALDMAIAALSQPNESLTLEQLREMGGQPVWVKVIGKTGISCDGWCEVEIRDKDPFAYVLWPGSEVEDIAKIEDYGKTWSCYAYPPAHIDREEWVSVEERLPEYNPGTGAKSYWVAKKDNAGNWQMKIAQYCDYGYAMTMDAETEVTWRDWDFTKIVNVTHWMPLPAPPAKEDQHEQNL